jgi:hypothetical protein
LVIFALWLFLALFARKPKKRAKAQKISARDAKVLKIIVRDIFLMGARVPNARQINIFRFHKSSKLP